MNEDDLLIHYSVLFSSYGMRFHGGLISKKTHSGNVARKAKEIISDVKADLMNKMQKWGVKPKDLIAFDVYYFKDKEEVGIFNFKK